MIAAEWNRNLYYVTGEGNGKHIPASLTCGSNSVHSPLMLISDIDKYPYLINEAADSKILNKKDNKDDENSASNEIISTEYKELFNKMINALDGILSGNDRIIVMTTNHIDKFSKIFLRPGRVDIMMEIGYMTPEVFREYIYHFYNEVIPKDIILKDKHLTVSKLQGDVVFREMTLDQILEKYIK